jgi:cytochrome c oxidase subunit 2
MSLLSPAEGWYYKKVSKDEKMWMVIALILCIMLFVWMVMWHVYGKQTLPVQHTKQVPLSLLSSLKLLSKEYDWGR